MEWGEIFTRKVVRTGAPMVTINKLGRIALNKSATVIFEQKAVESVLLLWRKNERKIGIRPILKKDPRSYTVKYGEKGNGAGFSAKTFLDFIDINFDQSKSYPARWNEDQALLEVEIPAEAFRDGRQQRLVELDTTAPRKIGKMA